MSLRRIIETFLSVSSMKRLLISLWSDLHKVWKQRARLRKIDNSPNPFHNASNKIFSCYVSNVHWATQTNNKKNMNHTFFPKRNGKLSGLTVLNKNMNHLMRNVFMRKLHLLALFENIGKTIGSVIKGLINISFNSWSLTIFFFMSNLRALRNQTTLSWENYFS